MWRLNSTSRFKHSCVCLWSSACVLLGGSSFGYSGLEDEYTGEIPEGVQALATQFAGLPQAEIVKGFSNRFRPMNLYKLQHLKVP